MNWRTHSRAAPACPRLVSRSEKISHNKEYMTAIPFRQNPEHPIAGASGPNEPIAIVGIGCRFPGNVDGPENFWSLLRDGIHVVSEIPSSRMDVDTFYDPRPATPGKMMTRWGGFLENITRFDAGFFGIAPREAERLDPQQRLLLEVAWEALENAGQLPERLKGSLTGVFIGLWLNDFEARVFADPSQADFYMTTGSGRYSASGRISYILGLQGPSITIDTACSSSLVAVHLACQSLWNDESTIALAGGANVILQPHISIAYSQSRMMAPDGRCKFGDAQADGYVRSEGAGLVVLKRLSRAMADNDPIYAVIRGGAVNNDGQSSGFLATPGQAGQEEMLRLAYQRSGVDPREVQYVEAHGTGTRAGDPIELGALGAVLGQDRSSKKPLLVGSVKTNLGHTEGAAGIAGLIKVALSLKHGLIPPSLHLSQYNPNIPWQELKLNIPTGLTSWDSARQRIAGVSAFGIAGTNAHLVLAEAPGGPPQSPSPDSGAASLLPLSAHTPEALRELAGSYLAALGSDNRPSLHDLLYTASCRRTHHAERLAVVGASHQEIADQLKEYLSKEFIPQIKTPAGQPKVAFVFPGQGAQWIGMGRELLRESAVFRKALADWDKAFKPMTDWSLLEQLGLEEDSPAYRLNEISVIQPVLVAIEVALAEIWRSWGIEPAAVVGHSMGEVAAAHFAGALTIEDAALVICTRSQLMQRTSGQGAMAVIGLPFSKAVESIKGLETRLSIAVQNSPKSVVVSGDPESLELVMEQLRKQDIFCRLIKVDVASHSPQMDPIRPELVAALGAITARPAAIPFYSTVTHTLLDGTLLDGEYWGKNLRQPVRFGETIQQLLDDDHTVFIEMSPHPILLASIEETQSETDRKAFGFASLRRGQPELATLLGGLGSLYTLGCPIDWNRVYPEGGNIVPLPSYPWQREHYWFETTSQKQSRPGAHPLLGQYIHSATNEHIWETVISTTRQPYLNDHQVRGAVVFPAAAFVEMVLAGIKEIHGSANFVISDMSINEAIFLPGDQEQVIQLIIEPGLPEPAEFHIHSRLGNEESGQTWRLNASGRISINGAKGIEAPSRSDHRDADTESRIPVDDFYAHAFSRGLEYGPGFRCIREIHRDSDGIRARIKLSAELESRASSHLIHPALADACFQLVLAALPESNQDTYLPTSIEKIQLHGRPNFDTSFLAIAIPQNQGAHPESNIFLFNEDEELVLSVIGLRMRRIAAKPKAAHELLHEIEWHDKPEIRPAGREANHYLIFSDRSDEALTLAERLHQDSHSTTRVSAGAGYKKVSPGEFEIDPEQPADYHRLFKEITEPIHGIIHLWSLGTPDSAPPVADANQLSILYLVQAIAQTDRTDTPRLWLVTRGTQTIHAQPGPVSVSQTPVWGMGAVIANEFPNLHCTRVDLGPVANDDEINLLSRIILTNDDEDQNALRKGQRYAARLKQSQPPAGSEAKESSTKKFEGDQAFQVQTASPGILDELAIKPVLRNQPKAGEVEISVKATGLNFMNVMSALGIYPGYEDGVGPLGIECAGIISRIGEGVTGFEAGDEVAAIAFNSLASHTVTDARLVVKKPTSLGFEAAASIPIAFLTAYYALHWMGRLQAGERVLIHSATGGVGLAAIQLARRAGAEVFATAGSPEKRELLREMGIRHIMDSRSLAFADDVRQATNGEGVDMVLNSLAGMAIAKGLEILKPYGRFLEIGKRDIYGNSKVGLLPFQKNLSYFAIDLDRMSRERPDIVGGILHEIFELIEAGELSVLPVHSYPVSKVSEGFRMMAQAKHVGKIAITMEDPEAAYAAPEGMPPIRSDGTYLITGGLGDLGLTFARWLALQGARHLVLLGRSEPNESASAVIGELQSGGVHVLTARTDVTRLDQLTDLFVQLKTTCPPLRGVVHAAGLLADGTILQMDREQFAMALAPKVLGAWNLHTLTANHPLDFFILFSSVAATLGTPGQVNYAAGNAYLDGLARFRRSKNLAALSINWGPWSEIGLAATQDNRGGRLMQQGLKSLSPDQGLDSMPLVMAQENSQIAVMHLDAREWCHAHPAAARSSLLRDLAGQHTEQSHQGKSPGGDIRDELNAIESGKQRRTMFETHVRQEVSQVLRLAPSRIPLDKPLRTLGLDSLMSIELRNRLENSLHIPLSATLIWNYPTVRLLTSFLAEKIGVVFETEDHHTEGRADAVEEGHSPGSEIENLSKAELDALLKEESDAIEDLLGDD